MLRSCGFGRRSNCAIVLSPPRCVYDRMHFCFRAFLTVQFEHFHLITLGLMYHPHLRPLTTPIATLLSASAQAHKYLSSSSPSSLSSADAYTASPRSCRDGPTPLCVIKRGSSPWRDCKFLLLYTPTLPLSPPDSLKLYPPSCPKFLNGH